MRNPWLDCNGLPAGPMAAMAALHFTDPHADLLALLSREDRDEAFYFACRSQLALFLPLERSAENLAKNRERLRIVYEIYRQIEQALRGMDFIALKGVTQCALFGIDPERRTQYDIDLYCPRESVTLARDALLAIGYESIQGMDAFPTDHLPALIRKTAWEWRQDFFDAEIPLAVELHFRFWNPELERLPAPGTEEFWHRRVRQPVGCVELGVLSPPDAVGYAALHLAKHLLRGNVRPFHVYEIASFLQLHAADERFWQEWLALHSPELRRLEAVSFRLAESWFGCAIAPAAREEIERLPASAQAWFDEFALSPATQRFHPNKDELWLHLALLGWGSSAARKDALSVARRRLFPANLPPPVKATYLPESALTLRRRLRQYLDYATYFNARAGHHIISLGTTLTSGARWWWRTNGLGRNFWLFLATAVVFNFALFIFFLLYNLYLVDLGYREELLGTVNASQRAGSLVGTLPAAFLARRLGLKRALIATIGGAAAISLLRAIVATQFPLAALAFIEGLIFATWAVIMAPCIAGAVDPKHRTTAFSIFFAAMFANGIVGNWIGGQLPALLHGKQNTLIFAAALIGVAILPVLRMRSPSTPPPAVPGARIYPRGRFLVRFLVPFAVWHLATGAFNPFNNVYFARLKFTVQEIGSIFSISQVVQVIAVLLAPMVIRRFGLINGIVWMMIATAGGLGLLASEPPAFAAVMAYAAYMAFQWMSEPGLNTLVMNHVKEEERSGASAITYLVAFSSQAAAALGAGQLIERAGYPPVLFGAALLAVAASALFGRVVSVGETKESSLTKQ